jgi:hypothetical protein
MSWDVTPSGIASSGHDEDISRQRVLNAAWTSALASGSVISAHRDNGMTTQFQDVATVENQPSDPIIMFAIAQSVIEISNAHQSAAALGLLSSFIAGPLCALRQALTAPASEAQCAGVFLPRRG